MSGSMKTREKPSYLFVILSTVLITILTIFAALDTLGYSSDRYTIFSFSRVPVALLLDKETGKVWSLRVTGDAGVVKVPVK